MICPAAAARFFIYIFDLPLTVRVFGFAILTFVLLIIVVLTLAISITCLGGTLALVITDTIQGLMCYPMTVVFTLFVLMTFSWNNEIIPVMNDRIAGESFLNPYDVSGLRDFNVFAMVVALVAAILNRASWIGVCNTSAAFSAHEQKMAGILGTWRNGFTWIFYILVAITIITLLNHRNFSTEAKDLRTTISSKICEELVADKETRRKITEKISALPPVEHVIGKDAPLSQKENLDTPLLETVRATLCEKDEAHGNAKFQEFRTLYHQMMLPVTMRKILPVGLMGLFALLMVVMISTDDPWIFSSALTISQDVILPFIKRPLTPSEHIRMLRWVSIGVGVIFAFGSFYMAQLDYINLFISLVCSMWLGRAGPVMIFGLYSRFGTTAGAFASLITGMGFSLGGILVQRNWADVAYPYLVKVNMVSTVDSVLTQISRPFNPWIVWEMNPIKAPVNSNELYFIAMLLGVIAYVSVSLLSRQKPFDLDRMLHRGKYNLGEEEKNFKFNWTPKGIFRALIGITSEYTRGDRIIAWSVFFYMIVYAFGQFLLVVIWNAISPWPKEWWSLCFLITVMIIPGIVAVVSMVWFFTGGIIDLHKMFKALKNRVDNPLDDGRVDGHDSLADKAAFEKVDHSRKQ